MEATPAVEGLNRLAGVFSQRWARLSPRAQKAWIFVLFCVLGLVLYGRVLNAPFFWDDHKMILENWTIRDLSAVENIWNEIDYPKSCFLTFLTFAVNYHIGGYEPFGYHLVNVGLHVFNAFFFFLFVAQLFQTPVMRYDERSTEPGHFALFTALIFLAHPLQTQAVSYIWSRTELLAGFFGMLAVWLYVSARNQKHTFKLILSIFVFSMGVFARGNLVVWPLLVLLIEIVFYGLSLSAAKSHIARCWKIFFVWLLAGIIAVGVLFYQLPRWNMPWLLDEPMWSRCHYLLNQFRVVVTYIRLSFLPYPQNVDYYFLPSRSFFEPKTLLSFALILGILAGSFIQLRRRRWMAFGTAWFFISLIPVSTLLVLTVLISESRVYFPLAGFALFITGAINRSRMLRPRRGVILAVLIGIYCSLTLARNELWRSPMALMEDTVRKSPFHARAHTRLGMLYARAGRLDEAAAMFRKSIHLDPGFIAAYNNLGVLYAQTGQIERAQEVFEKIIAKDPEYLQAYLNLGYLLLPEGKFWLTEQIFKLSALHCGPTEAALIGLADNYLARRHANPPEIDQAARQRLMEALEINPRSDRAYWRLGYIAELQSEFEMAARYYQKGLLWAPRNYKMCLALARVYGRLGQSEQAVEAFERAIHIRPQDPRAYAELGKYYFSLGEHARARYYYQEHARRLKQRGVDENAASMDGTGLDKEFIDRGRRGR